MQIENLVVEENVIYAGYQPYSSSQDAGKTWVEMNRDDIPGPILTNLDQQPSFPLTVCDPENMSRCYRTNKDEKIEVSSDGGATWQIGWQIPAGRRMFIDRYQRQPGPCPPIFDIGPYDLAFVDAEPAHVLVAAMGTNGILTHTPQEGWNESAFPDYTEVPLKVDSFEEAGTVAYPEITFFSILALIAIPLLHHWWDFREQKYSSPPDDEYKHLSRHNWMWIAVIVLAVSLLVGGQIIIFVPIYPLYGLGFILALPAVSATLEAVFASREERLRQWLASGRNLVIWLTVEGLLWLGILPYSWWAMADIQTYGTASAIALVSILLLAGLSLFLLDRLARKAVKEPPPTAAKPTDNING
jgi:uncharacterized membrane protein